MEDLHGGLDPREPFGHPAVARLRDQSSDDAAGHDEYDPTGGASQAAGAGAEAQKEGEALPPMIRGDGPQESLAERAARTLGEA